MGLASEYKNEQSPIGTWLKHLFGLTFLPPAEVGDCFAEDFTCEKTENSKLDQFADYLVDNYIDSESKFPPVIWAENSCSILRTTNTCESLNLFFFFFNCHSRFYCHTAFTVPFGRPFFQFISLFLCLYPFFR
jgi:hypothetical protein